MIGMTETDNETSNLRHVVYRTERKLTIEFKYEGKERKHMVTVKTVQ